MSTIRILFLGDIVGAPGRAIFQKHIDTLKTKHSIDSVMVNGENSAQGRGITSRIVRFFRHNGVDVITSGNHIWRYKEIYEYLRQHTDLLRPANYPSRCPGVGVTTFVCKGFTVGVMNIQGQVFMHDHVSNPFYEADSILTYLKDKTKCILLDFHAEASSEKIALATYLDGRVSAVVGTHTHVQTADERILPKGTAYITDVGMSGAIHSSIGMKSGPIIQKFLTQMPVKFEVEKSGPLFMSGVIIEIDVMTGKSRSIERIKVIDDQISLDDSD